MQHYCYSRMIADLRCDLRKYVELFRPAPLHRPPSMIRVLLSSPAFFFVAGYRLRYWLWARQERTSSRALKCLLKGVNLLVPLFGFIALKTNIGFWTDIGPGFYLSNRGGITLGAKRLGAGCVIHHNVSVGFDRNETLPEIGDNVWIGPDTVVYANVVGNGVVVQGETVLGKSVPDRCVIRGKPGRIVERGFDNSCYLSSPDPYFRAEPRPALPRQMDLPADIAGPADDESTTAAKALFQNIRADLDRYCRTDSSLAWRIRMVRTRYGFQATVLYRFGQWIDAALAGPLLLPLRYLLRLLHTSLSIVFGRAFGIKIDRRASIGKGLYIEHFGGIAVGPCRIGENCSIHQHVRLEAGVGAAGSGAPQIGNNVWIGAHARIIGPVTVGQGSAVAAGAVVIADVRQRCLVAGDPARVVALDYDNSDLL